MNDTCKEYVLKISFFAMIFYKIEKLRGQHALYDEFLLINISILDLLKLKNCEDDCCIPEFSLRRKLCRKERYIYVKEYVLKIIPFLE